jgi:hypothetical protein
VYLSADGSDNLDGVSARYGFINVISFNSSKFSAILADYIIGLNTKLVIRKKKLCKKLNSIRMEG